MIRMRVACGKCLASTVMSSLVNKFAYPNQLFFQGSSIFSGKVNASKKSVRGVNRAGECAFQSNVTILN